MARSPSKFRQCDLSRAIKAARAAGVEIGRVEVDADGKIVLVIGNSQQGGPVRTGSALDEWIAKDARKNEGA